MQHSIPFPRPPSKGTGQDRAEARELIREGNEEKAALFALFSLLHCPCSPAQSLSPPLEMILHRTRLDGAISPMKSILFLGPFSSLSLLRRRENRRAVAEEEEEKPDEIGKGSRGAEREFIGAQFSAE